MVDIGEALLAAVGVRAVLSRDPVKFLAPDRATAAAMDKRVLDGVRDLVNDATGRTDPDYIDYDEMLEQLSAPMDQARVEALAASFGPMDSAPHVAFVGQAGRAVRYLQTQMPISTIVTLTGVQSLRPSDVAIGNFEDTFGVVDDPLSIFGIIAQDRLTSQLALDVMTVYPSLYVALVQAIVLRVLRQKAIDKEWDPPWERSLAVLLAVPGLDPGVRQMLQTPVQPAAAAPPPGPPKQPGAAPPSLLATPSQKLDIRA